MEDRQFIFEARAKILWGESPDAVLAFLRDQGQDEKSARELLARFARERIAAIRDSAVRRLVIGALLMLVPVFWYLLIFARTSNLLFVPDTKPFAYAIVVGLIGLGIFANGLVAYFRPSSQKGDLSHRLD